MRTLCRVVAAALLLLIGPAIQAGEQGLGGSAEDALDYCFYNLAGLGICSSGSAFCPDPATGSCDEATPCANGQVCIVDSCCPTNLSGICAAPSSSDAGCSNPGTCGSFSACSPVVFHEDFTGGLGKLPASTVCGAGGAIFVENACVDSAGASSPLDHARWGTAPASCSDCATNQHRVVASTGAVNVSSCDRAVLDFDYLFDLDEPGQFDRGFVTVAIDAGPEKVVASNQPAFGSASLSCAGGILPIGNLASDGAWHHYRAGIGDGSSVIVRFYGETFDYKNNFGQGWLFDDVRIDCGELIYGNGFEGGNALSWSATTAPPPLIQIFALAGTCGTFLPCDRPGGNCANVENAEGATYCAGNFSCSTGCTTSGDCAAGEMCFVNTCCGGPVCGPAVCNTTGSLSRQELGPSAASPGTD